MRSDNKTKGMGLNRLLANPAVIAIRIIIMDIVFFAVVFYIVNSIGNIGDYISAGADSASLKEYFGARGKTVDIIKLSGSVELAPVMGLSDVIVDIVETGPTLKENNLEVLEEILPISARLISNKVSFKFKNNEIMEICDKINGICGAKGDE